MGRDARMPDLHFKLPTLTTSWGCSVSFPVQLPGCLGQLVCLPRHNLSFLSISCSLAPVSPKEEQSIFFYTFSPSSFLDLKCKRHPRGPKLKFLNNGRLFGSMVTYLCQEPYILHGSPKRSCRANGKWDGKKASCSK